MPFHPIHSIKAVTALKAPIPSRENHPLASSSFIHQLSSDGTFLSPYLILTATLTASRNSFS